MPYKDPERRRQAARKWRSTHREQRAAYMRRYRKARSSGRSPGRPRSRDLTHPLLPVSTERFEPYLTRAGVPAAGPVRVLSTTASRSYGDGEVPPFEPARAPEEAPPSPSATLLWDASFPYGRS